MVIKKPLLILICLQLLLLAEPVYANDFMGGESPITKLTNDIIAKAESGNYPERSLGSENKVLDLSTSNGGLILFNDGMEKADGFRAKLNSDDISTTRLTAAPATGGEIIISNNNLELVQDDLLDNKNIKLESGKLDLHNGVLGVATFNDFTGVNGVLSLDVDPVAQTADKLVINGDLKGNTKLLINATSAAKPENEILFAETPNDNDATAGSFEVWRVAGSPYQWTTRYDTALREWYMNTFGDPIYNNPMVTPESIAYMGLNSAGIEQTRGMLRNVRNKVAASNDVGSPLYNVWANPVYSSAKVDSPVKYDAELSGMEAGGDIQINTSHRVGVFGSYRQGKYDFNGEADHFNSNIESQIEIDSYIGGLYYRYDYRNLWTMATIYGGIQKAEIKTDDGLRSDSDGIALGGNIESGIDFKITDSMVIAPSVSASYAQISYDNIKDDAGKTTTFGDAKQVELEAGVKFEKMFDLEHGCGKIYFKPSLVQTLVYGDKIHISGLETVNSLEDETLARFELGGSLSLTDNLNAFATAEYTINSGYEDTAFSLGFSYSF